MDWHQEVEQLTAAVGVFSDLEYLSLLGPGIEVVRAGAEKTSTLEAVVAFASVMVEVFGTAVGAE